MTHQFTVSTAAAARLLLEAARISATVVTLVADVVEGRRSVDSCPWEEAGAEALGADLSKAIHRSRRAREAARKRRRPDAVTTPAPAEAPAETPSVAPSDATEYPFEMRRTSRGMEKFYRWPDRSWRRIPPTPEQQNASGFHGKKRRRR